MPNTNKEINLSQGRAFGDLYERTYLSVFRFIYALHGGPRQEVEDLTADTFLRAWRARRGFKGDAAAAQSWLFKIARNNVIDASRRRRARRLDQKVEAPVEELSLAEDVEPLEALLARREDFAILWRLLSNLSDENREILVLRYVLAWQVQEIAAHLGLQENTVSQRIHRMIDRMREDWPDEDG